MKPTEKLSRQFEAARIEYQRQIEVLALELRPKFESGELRGYVDEDSEDGRHGASSPRFKLERMALRRLVKTDASAYAILAVSPSEPMVDGGTTLADIRGAAGEAAALDLLRLARSRGWSKPANGETPTNRALGLRRGSITAWPARRRDGAQGGPGARA